MVFALFWKGLIVGLMVTIPLGPIGVLCIQRTLNKGRVSGFVSGLGASAADAIFAVIAGFGISYIISFVKAQQVYFQIFGGLIVMFLGIHIFYTNPVRQLRLQRMNKNRLHHDFLSVFFLTITNPLAILLFLAMFAGINVSDHEINAFGLSSLVGGVLAGSAGWWFLVSFIISIFRERIRLRNIWWMNKVAGAIVFVLGILAFISIWIL